MSFLKRLEKLEKKNFGNRNFAGYAVAFSENSYMCSGADITTRAEYEDFVEEFEKNSDYKIQYIMDFAGGRDIKK